MDKLLLIIGSNSHILSQFYPTNQYSCVIHANRSSHHPNYKNFTNQYFHYNLFDFESNDRLLSFLLRKNPQTLHVLFASYISEGLEANSPHNLTQLAASANILMPLNLFHTLSNALKGELKCIFISSMYAHVSPNPQNYTERVPVNPMYYGAFKSAVEQGIRWLSLQSSEMHMFNSIVLGAMPKQSVLDNHPDFVCKLKNSIPSNSFVGHVELNGLINCLFHNDTVSFRGASLKLDGGYTIC